MKTIKYKDTLITSAVPKLQVAWG